MNEQSIEDIDTFEGCKIVDVYEGDIYFSNSENELASRIEVMAINSRYGQAYIRNLSNLNDSYVWVTFYYLRTHYVKLADSRSYTHSTVKSLQNRCEDTYTRISANNGFKDPLYVKKCIEEGMRNLMMDLNHINQDTVLNMFNEVIELDIKLGTPSTNTKILKSLQQDLYNIFTGKVI